MSDARDDENQCPRRRVLREIEGVPADVLYCALDKGHEGPCDFGHHAATSTPTRQP